MELSPLDFGRLHNFCQVIYTPLGLNKKFQDYKGIIVI